MMAGMDATPAAETPAHPTLDDRIEIGLQQAKDLPVEELGDPSVISLVSRFKSVGLPGWLVERRLSVPFTR